MQPESGSMSVSRLAIYRQWRVAFVVSRSMRRAFIQQVQRRRATQTFIHNATSSLGLSLWLCGLATSKLIRSQRS